MKERVSYIKRPKLANINQIVFVVSSKHPKPDLLLLDKQLAFAEFLHIKPVIVLNKIDLDDKHEFLNIQKIYEEIGYKVIINNTHWGLVYHNEVFQRLEKGEHLKGYIKEVRKDEKIDVSLTPLGYQKVEGIAKTILDSLKAQGGYAAVHDKSEPELIYSLFRCSKKAFKQAIGALYKQKIINIEPEGIRLIDKE